MTKHTDFRGGVFIPASTDDQFLIVCRFVIQGKVSHAYIERDVDDTTLATTFSDIFDGQVENVVAVKRFNESLGTFRDVTEDVARGFLSRIANEYDSADDVPSHLVDFCEAHFGAGCVDECFGSARSDYAEHNTLNRAQQGV